MSKEVTPQIIKENKYIGKFLISHSNKFNEIYIFDGKGYNLECLSNREYFGLHTIDFKKHFFKFLIVKEGRVGDYRENQKILDKKEKYSHLSFVQIDKEIIYADKLENLSGIGLRYEESRIFNDIDLKSDIKSWLREKINIDKNDSEKVVGFIINSIKDNR